MVSPHVRVPVGAHYGWRDWLVQRVTAVVMALYTGIVLAIALWNGGLDYATWKAVFANEAFRLASFVFMAALLWHAWVGVRNVLMDYVKPAGPRLLLQCAVIVVLVGELGWTLLILWGGA